MPSIPMLPRRIKLKVPLMGPEIGTHLIGQL